MFLDRLESGFLLFETKQGLIRVDLSFKQRIYLMWTFRHFRQLSPLLLSSRERALANRLFQHKTGLVEQPDDSWPVIGVIENFVPPVVEIDDSPRMEEELPQERGRQGEHQEEAITQGPDIPPQIDQATSTAASLAWSRLAAAVGILSLSVIFVAAWHRIERVPSSQASSEPPLAHVKAIQVAEVPQVTPAAIVGQTPIPTTSQIVKSEATTTRKTSVKTVSTTAVAKSKRPRRDTDDASASKPPAQENGIEASRPPLRVVYPMVPKVRVRGKVALRAAVDAAGVVRTVSVVSGNPELAAAAVRAVRQWRYRPFLKDGQAVATETNISISFIADDAISMSFPPSVPALP